MMPKSAAHTFFSIPELVISLSTLVPTPDLVRCILVCKDWSRLFEPILWRHLHIGGSLISLMDTSPQTNMVVLARNLRHIETVHFTRANNTQLQLLVQGLPYHFGDTVKDPRAVCTRLRGIDVFDLDFECLELMSKPLITLLDCNLHLTHLDVNYGFFDIDGVSVAVSKLHRLQYLKVHSYDHHEPTIHKPYLFFQSCLVLPELTELTFSRGMELNWDHIDQAIVVRNLEAIIHEATIVRFSENPCAKRIRTLRLPSNPSGIINPLPLLLLESGLLDLETCEIPWFREDATTWEIQQVVQRHCPNLRHLEYSEAFEEGQDGATTRAFIRGCSGVQSFTSFYFMDGPDDAPRRVIAELVRHHHTTLEVLELTSPVELRSYDLQRVLSQCKQLKRFWVLGMSDKDNMSGIAFRDIARSDWACAELKELGVTLNRCRSEEILLDAPGEEEEQQDDPQVWLASSITRRAYQQIGRLKKLEVLEIDIDRTSRTKAKEQDYVWDLTLWKGWLSEWAGLTNLRSLRLRADFWSYMAQEDVEFMHEHWPLLDEIVISNNISDFHTKRHWQWLLERRPHLRFKGMRQS